MHPLKRLLNPQGSVSLSSAFFLAWAVGLCSSQAATVAINPNLTFQTIQGFGAAGSASSDQVLDFLVYELGISMYRTGIEPRVLHYPVDAEEIDYENFTITGTLGGAFTRDVDFVKSLQARRPEIRFVGTVWSPPGWMKSNGALTGTGAGFIGSDPDNHLREDMYENFAKFIVEYQKLLSVKGVPFYAIGPQNEPLFTQSFDSCLYYADQFAQVVKAIGEAFTASGTAKPLIYGPEDMTLAHYGTSRHKPYVDALLEPGVSAYFDVFATHGYTDGVQSGSGLDPETYWNGIKQFGREYWITEGGTGGHNWPSPITSGIGNYLHYALVEGNASVFLGWQLEGAADEHHIMDAGSPTKKTYTAMHYWRYIRPGFIRMAADISGSDSSGVQVSAFRDVGGEHFVLVAINKNSSQRTLNLQLSSSEDPGVLRVYQTDAVRNFADAGTAIFQNGTATLTLPASSISTLVKPKPVQAVSLEPASLELDIGDRVFLQKTVSPVDATDPKVTWESSNPSVVAVNGSGEISGLREGDATITITSEDGGHSASTEVQVRNLMWANWEVSNDGWVNTGPDFLGWIHTNQATDWIYSLNHNGWLYLKEDMVYGDSAWAFMPLYVMEFNRLWEAEAMNLLSGEPETGSTSLPMLADTISNVALNKPVEVSGEAGESVGSNLVDGDWSGSSETRWAVTGYPQWAIIDLGGLHHITEFRMYPYQNRGYQFTISISDDKENFSTVVDRTNNWSDTFVFTNPVDVSGRYIRFEVVSGGSYPGDWVNILELVAMGSPLTVPVESVAIEPKSLTRGIGQIYQLQAEVIPALATNKDVTWSSSNESVASVDSAGRVTAHSMGEATITVTTVEGGFTDSLVLEVNELGNWAMWSMISAGVADTGPFAGWIYVANGSDWIYLYEFNRWAWLPEDRVSSASGGAWAFFP